MKALITLEWGMNVPVLTKLKSNFGNLKQLTNFCTKELIRIPEWADFDSTKELIRTPERADFDSGVGRGGALEAGFIPVSSVIAHMAAVRVRRAAVSTL